jgi:pyrimidine and pyridine-specific 5'-nucleotidase
MGSSGPESLDHRPILFMDIDNCLYPRNKKVHDIMQELIDRFFIKHLSLSAEDALMLHQKYYREYGLAIEGLYRHHKILPLEFNREVDDALPLDEILKPDPGLRRLLQAFDKDKVKMWLFTNAHITHGKRVVKLLGVEDCFEGITYCDYAAKELLCKPRPEMFEKAEREAGAPSSDQCYFIGM